MLSERVVDVLYLLIAERVMLSMFTEPIYRTFYLVLVYAFLAPLLMQAPVKVSLKLFKLAVIESFRVQIGFHLVVKFIAGDMRSSIWSKKSHSDLACYLSPATPKLLINQRLEPFVQYLTLGPSNVGFVGHQCFPPSNETDTENSLSDALHCTPASP